MDAATGEVIHGIKECEAIGSSKLNLRIEQYSYEESQTNCERYVQHNVCRSINNGLTEGIISHKLLIVLKTNKELLLPQ